MTTQRHEDAGVSGDGSSDLPVHGEVQDESATDVDSGPQPQYKASILTAPPEPIPTEMVEGIQGLERELGMQVWMLIQTDGAGRMLPELLPELGKLYDNMTWAIRHRFFGARNSLPKESIALVIESPGGSAKAAYQLATFLKRRCGGFVAVVPRYAKSAATLLALGADKIILGDYGELGPLDAQLFDSEREQWASALDEVQAMDQLHSSALNAFLRTMSLLINATEKRSDSLIPLALHFAAEVTQPLVQDLDTVHYTSMARVLKIGEEYAKRLLRSNPNYSDEQAQEIARALVEDYPDHDFVIDAKEASHIGLRTDEPSLKQGLILNELAMQLDGGTFIGRLEPDPLTSTQQENGH